MSAHATTTLVLGGARSGKSRHAQELAEGCTGELVFVATAQAFDGEMAERIAAHRRDRDARWSTLEAPTDLPGAIGREARAGRVLLVDCLTLWVSNLMLGDADMDQASDALVSAIEQADGDLIFVSNEVGFGIVPDNALARRFRDAAGRLNQRVAAVCDRVELVVAGLPLRIKG
ncbi:bifunctional adenosylcobinamide kinase/adenosylcobinamide-phosphate guanylyltransferase [Sphingomonas sp. Mn802worker]|uniref:bifunctional adenosylcobinamide kinase/adenosylcobinamide-phosphate guanylyltransferase n=1 Tax=Sphingomonas sp. Mn802worker TaxID=629773 RepID=UPI00036D4AB5|nr:bifunctional adenosylcobinamide kinase/adenosylcobinamide-phosphate guanylyltransferase [Sphingomonas sp. Mn802worker]